MKRITVITSLAVAFTIAATNTMAGAAMMDMSATP